MFKRLAEAMGRPELAKDERYATHGERGQHQLELDDLIADWTKDFSSEELRNLMNEYGVPNGKIFTAPDMLENEQYAARDAIISMNHPTLGEIKMQNVFPKMSETQGKVKWCGPELGQHNDEIYREMLNMDESQIEEYKEKGII